MSQTYDDIMSGARDHSIRFADLCKLLEDLGFAHSHGSGSHHKFGKQGIVEIIVLQPVGSYAKSYQVRQVRNLLKKYRMEVSR